MHINNLKIGHRLGLSFGVIAILLATIATLTYVRIGSLNNNINLTNDDRYPQTVYAHYIKDKVNEAVISMRSAMLLTDPVQSKAEIDSIETGAKLIIATIAKLEKLAVSNEDLEYIKLLTAARGKFVAARKHCAGLIESKQFDEARASLLNEVTVTQRGYLAALDQLIDHQDGLMRAVSEQSGKDAAQTRHLILILTVIALLISISVAWYVTRTITKPLANAVQIARRVADGDLSGEIRIDTTDETGELLSALRNMQEGLINIVTQVRSGTDTIAVSSTEIAAGIASHTEQQANSLEQTISAMGQLTSMVKKNSDNANEASMTAASASDTASAGGEAVGKVIGTMTSINDSSKKIVDIISVIDGIAFQTNILALNAAVEAARAGEQGRGFAVVASEVRSLAQRSASAAKEIKNLIADSVDKVGSGTLLVEHAGSIIDEVVVSVHRVTGIVAEITAASKEQSIGIEQVHQSITQMDHVTHENATLVEHAASGLQALQGEAIKLAHVVSLFKLNAAPV